MRKPFSASVAACLVAVALAALTTACAKEYWVAVDDPSKATAVEITIADTGFEPATMRVSKGALVVWTNLDQVPHSVTSATGTFDIELGPGEACTHTFSEYGSFEYADRLGSSSAAGTVSVNFGRVAINR
jgi:plastocyanin